MRAPLYKLHKFRPPTGHVADTLQIPAWPKKHRPRTETKPKVEFDEQQLSVGVLQNKTCP